MWVWVNWLGLILKRGSIEDAPETRRKTMKTKIATIAVLAVLASCGRIFPSDFAIKKGEALGIYVPDWRPEMGVEHVTFLCEYSTEGGGSVVIPCLEEVVAKNTSDYEGTWRWYDPPTKAVGAILFGKGGAFNLQKVCGEGGVACILWGGVAIDTNGGVTW